MTDHVDVPADRDLLDMAFRRVGRMRVCSPLRERSLRPDGDAEHGQDDEGPTHANAPLPIGVIEMAWAYCSRRTIDQITLTRKLSKGSRLLSRDGDLAGEPCQRLRYRHRDPG